MKILLSVLSLLWFSGLHGQVDNNFEKTVLFIKKKVACCSAPFSTSGAAKVDALTIEANGSVTLSYSDKRPKNRFNLFELYKENDKDSGIDTILGGKFIQFSVSDKRMRLIRFATVEDTKEVYQAFLQIMKPGSNDWKILGDLNFSQTVALINIRLSMWAEHGNNVKLGALETGTVTIVNRPGQMMEFNLFDLLPPRNGDWIGIETVSCNPRAHAPLAWINFKTLRGTAAFIRLKCATPGEELLMMKNAFLHLKSLCKDFNVLNRPPAGAIHFVGRNANIKSNNKTLAGSIRATDKKSGADTSILINSNGEGWLDKDSLPIGEWHFYAKNTEGKEYLFKSGMYQRTEPGMFSVNGIDSSDLAKNYHLTFQALQQDHVRTVAFVKSGKWSYYHVNGKLWKNIFYSAEQLPIEISVVLNDMESATSPALIVRLQEILDEWISTDTVEYNEDVRK